MKLRRAQLYIETDAQLPGCEVGLRTLLHEIVEQYDLSELRYLLVKDERGNLIGVVETDEILARIAAGNEIERQRWYNMPVAAVLRGRTAFEPCRTSGDEDCVVATSTPVESSLVSDSAGDAAVFVDQKLFVSWERVQSALHYATVDPVTNLPNRSAFDRRLQEDFHRAGRHGHSLAVLLIDLDHFKAINDDYGHSTGDRVLQAVGAALERSIRSYDHVARFGGDEFVITCNGCRPGEIDIPVRRLKSSLEAVAQDSSNSPRSLSLSIGAAVAHNVGTVESPEELLETADQCLYRAKRDGRARAYKIELDADDERHDPVLIDAENSMDTAMLLLADTVQAR